MSDRSFRLSETAFAVVVALGFAALALAGVLRHEMWRDELEIWLIARDSTGLRDLLANMGTEGHPPLWYLLTWLLARFTRAPLAIQLLNVAIGTATAALVAGAAPLSRRNRVLVVLGYLPLYEFTVITRSYALECLLLAAFCARLAQRRRVDGLGALSLCLLAQTHLYGALFAGLALAVVLVASRRRPPGTAPSVSRPGAAAVLVAVGAAVAHTLAQALAMGPDHLGSYRPGFDLPWLLDCVGTVGRGFLPLPDPTRHESWNSTVLALLPPEVVGPVGALAAIVALVLATRALRRSIEARVAFLVGSAALLSLTLFFWFGWVRHHAQHLVWFAACAWIAVTLVPGSPPQRPSREIALTAFLSVHVLLGGYAYLRDLALPFSNARAVARYIDGSAMREAPIVGSIDYAVEPVSGYLDRPVWYPESDRFGTFLDWSDRRRMVPATKAIADARGLAAREGRDVLLVLSYPWGEMPLGSRRPIGDDATLESIARFRGALVADENYDLYRVSIAGGSAR